ncbi:Uncharacterized protein LSUB1_G005202 [Lachnellula subtilissima]|uniref:Calcium permeable stress-gated cation channel n=1 Tax=Lachnellula subtilissima TaxID=602034 RepID=A0A8H8RLD2_9HELO|nr:Uncharacterized protein LSUB1_G005202 [Lachnellula subtilissima]
MDTLRTLGDNLLKRDEPTSGPQELLNLLANPYQQALLQNGLYAGLATSVGFTLLLAIGFSLLRPYNSVVYAPKLKVADERHAPPPMGKGMFAWVGPVWGTKEQDLIPLIGLDATVFLRILKMCRNIFLTLSAIGCSILIPINLIKGARDKSWTAQTLVSKVTPINTSGDVVWGMVVCAWLFNFVVAGFLWWNYRAILRLRRQYYDSPEYQASLHARTLMLNDIPKALRSDEGIGRLIDEVVPTSSFSRTTIARNVKDLPELIEQHNSAVRKLEKHLANYLKDPSNLPAKRPEKMDAITYLTGRIKEIEMEIKEVRLGVDSRNPLPYGFASYEAIEEAHSIAFAAKSKHPQGSTIVLSPRPNDIIWKNMPLSKSTRRRRRFINNIWFLLLTIVWVAPNAMIAVFLTRLEIEPRQQESVMWQLSSTHFFVFNFLIVFSLFSTVWTFVSTVIQDTQKGQDAWEAIKKYNFGQALIISLCNISPFWITWLLQRNLGAAVDLAQLWSLLWSFCARKFSSPTPREMIELTAPPAFEYAAYYNYFLFYSTVTLCFATIQPLCIPACALYFLLDVWLKKYLLLYVFITKTESGGMFWRMFYNRMVFATVLSNLLVFLAVWVRGNTVSHVQAYAVVPLPFLMIAFKIYCKRAFDDKIHYYTLRNMLQDPEDIPSKIFSDKKDRLASRFGHPALYRPLITPMVHARAQNILASVYGGRLTDSNNAYSGESTSVSGYSDTYALDPMQGGQPGRTKSSKSMPGFEMVPENKLDFSYFKGRAEFGEDHGGGGGLYGKAEDIIRTDTPGASSGYNDSRPGTPVGGMMGRQRAHTPANMPVSYDASGDIGSLRRQNSQTNLMLAAAEMPVATPGGHHRDQSQDRHVHERAPGFLGGGPQGYGGLPQHPVDDQENDDDPMSYDYFRMRRAATQNQGEVQGQAPHGGYRAFSP